MSELISNNQPFELLSDDRKTLQLIYNHLANITAHSNDNDTSRHSSCSHDELNNGIDLPTQEVGNIIVIPEQLINYDEPLIDYVDLNGMDYVESRYSNFSPQITHNNMDDTTTFSNDSNLSIDPQEFILEDNNESRYSNYSHEELNNGSVILAEEVDYVLQSKSSEVELLFAGNSSKLENKYPPRKFV